MTEVTERLSLGDIEALVSDALTRAGVQEQAATATAWAISTAERSGDRASGLGRVPRLLEGVRMASISATAEPVLLHTPENTLRVNADHGLSDAAVSIGFNALVETVGRHGIAFLSVTATGDTPAPSPWIDGLAAHGILGVSIGGFLGSRAASANDGQSAPGLVPSILPAPLSDGTMHALAEELPITAELDDMPAWQPANGSLCLIAIAQERGTNPNNQPKTEQSRNNRSPWHKKADRQTVDVPASLLMRILAA